jgi:hypothetical protein
MAADAVGNDVVDPFGSDVLAMLPPRLDSLVQGIGQMSEISGTIDWGFESLNRAAPWPMNAIAAVSAPKGGGKTSFALEVSRRYATKNGPVLYVALEQTAPMIAARVYAQEMGVSQEQLIRGELTVDPNIITTVPLFIAAKMPLAGIADALDLMLEVDGRPPLVVVDYVQRYAIGSRDLRIGVLEAMATLLTLTESRKMGTLIVSQTSRSGSRRARDGATSGEDLVDVDAESGAIESDAAVKLVVTFKSRNGEAATDVGVVVAKNRFGCVGARLGFRFEGASGRWIETGDLPPVSANTRASNRLLDAFRRTEGEGFPNKTAARAKAGGNAEDVGRAFDELVAEGLVVRNSDSGWFVLSEPTDASAS